MEVRQLRFQHINETFHIMTEITVKIYDKQELLNKEMIQIWPVSVTCYHFCTHEFHKEKHSQTTGESNEEQHGYLML